MKAKTIYVSIYFETEEGGLITLDYPQNVPLPRIGEFVIYSDEENVYSGTVGTIHHTITQGLANIQILTKRNI